MRVLFVYSLRDGLTARRPLASLGDIHIGLSYLSAYLKARHHSTRVVVLSSEAKSLALLDRAVADFEPQLVALTAVSTQYPFISKAARHLRRASPSVPLIIGGVHATLKPEEVMQDDFDAVCVGEGEAPLAELCQQLECGLRPARIPNLWVKQPNGQVERNPTREFMSDLGALPFPDRELWRDWVMARQATNQVVLPSRGCPYVCTYCSNHALRKVAAGKYVRLRPPENILEEIRYLKRQFPETSEIYLQSETIAIDVNWLDELSRQIESFNTELEHKITLTCNFRIARAFLTEQVFAALARANVRTMEIGLESGSERLRCGVLRRHYSNGDFFRAVELARHHGMRVNVYNMIGLPGETLEDYWKTVEVNRRVCPDQSITSIFFPYPGTDLYETCKSMGLLPEMRPQTSERWRATLDFPTFPKREIQRAFEWFDYRIYAGRRSWLFRVRKMLRRKAYAHHLTHAVFMRLLPLWHAVVSK